MSKVATPMIDVKLKGQKGGTKKQKNTSDELVEVNTGTIDKVWAIKYPSLITSRSSQTKDTKINFTQMTTNFMRELEKVYNVATKKDFNKLLEIVDEKTIENLGNIKAMLESNEIRQGYIQATENLSVNGEVKKKSA
jgi:1,2-phenylacetyl-CoA epoxidase PaaB subunit